VKILKTPGKFPGRFFIVGEHFAKTGIKGNGRILWVLIIYKIIEWLWDDGCWR
jgi:hypothetical protein